MITCDKNLTSTKCGYVRLPLVNCLCAPTNLAALF